MMSDINHVVKKTPKYFVFENQPYKCKMKKVSLYKYFLRYQYRKKTKNSNIAF